jgi:hypothetical protein
VDKDWSVMRTTGEAKTTRALVGIRERDPRADDGCWRLKRKDGGILMPGLAGRSGQLPNELRQEDIDIAGNQRPYHIDHRRTDTQRTEGFPVVQPVQLGDAFRYRQVLREVLLGANHDPGSIRVQEICARVQKLRTLRR